MQAPPPTHLYKYQRLTAHSLSSVLNGTVWMASPTSFNDPFDCAIPLARSKIKESITHALQEVAKRQGIRVDQIPRHNEVTKDDALAFEFMRKGLLTTMSKVGVLCLSATPLEILMWSHYADNHKGFCIEFDFSDGSRLRQLARPVRYQEEIPSMGARELITNSEDSFVDTCIFTKARQWAYEQEWRVFQHEGNKSFNAPSEITAVIFGARMPPSERTMLREAIKHKSNIQLKEASLCEDRFAVEIHESAP